MVASFQRKASSLGILEILFLGSLDDRGEVVFGPLSGGRKDDVSGHD